MVDETPRALNTRLAGTLLDAALALTWWGLFALLVWVCFLREPPRSLALTLAWFASPGPALVGAVLVLVLAGAVRARLPGRGRHLGIVSLCAGLLTMASWCAGRLAA